MRRVFTCLVILSILLVSFAMNGCASSEMTEAEQTIYELLPEMPDGVSLSVSIDDEMTCVFISASGEC